MKNLQFLTDITVKVITNNWDFEMNPKKLPEIVENMVKTKQTKTTHETNKWYPTAINPWGRWRKL